MISRACCLSLLSAAAFCTRAVAQDAPVTADFLVDQLIENAAVYRATVPSLTAHESILSGDSGQLLLLKGSHHASAEATMRVMRTTADDPLEEIRQITEIDGKPVPLGKHVVLPTSVNGGFGGLAGVFFRRESRYYFNFVLAPHTAMDATYKLTITLRPEAASLPHCPVKGSEGMSATALVAADSHQMVHFEWTLPADFAARSHHWPFASVDLAPTRLGDEIFWLPTTVVARGGTGKNQNEWIAKYSDYHRYTASSMIVPSLVDGAPQ